MDQIDELARLLRSSECMLIFTGAGISTESGIPDYRGPQGVWKTRQPVYFHEFLASEEKRIEYWEFKLESWEQFRAAQPNAAHAAIAHLEARGQVEAVVTQNIDGLHQEAGCKNVIEMHGTDRAVSCLECGDRSETTPWMEWFAEHRTAPRCPKCGGLLKSATISFGQNLDPAVLEEATAAASRADLALSLGSTLSVNPAAMMPLITAKNGAPYVIINRGETEHDRVATLRLDADVTEVLPAAVAAL
jgi:NAD-dependent deacetylase